MGKVILPETVISLYRSQWGTESGEIVTFGTGTVPSVDITPGKKYVVTHDGVDYVIEAVDLEVEGTHFDCLGDYPITTTRSVPFLYASVYEYGYSLFHDYKNTGGSTTIKISEYDESAETEPISLDPISLTLSWLVGRRIAGQRGNKPKEPIAYLYNGVQMPKLPEWDREMYPYAVIDDWSADDNVYQPKKCYAVVCSNQRPFYNGEVVLSNTPAQTFTCMISFDEEFSYSSGVPFGEWYFSHKEDHLMNTAFESVVWTNTDILNEDGSVYLAASEPIPIYE